MVNLDGGWDDRLKETLAALDEAHPGRFLTFALVNFEGIDDPPAGDVGDQWFDSILELGHGRATVPLT